ncbi:MAG: hypothetical protein J07HX64_01834 [halophilic archaeon J07HX64]|nr:MAG: hypothetical protein J07HX64_01834 [halophilic archaeon J07HX64]
MRRDVLLGAAALPVPTGVAGVARDDVVDDVGCETLAPPVAGAREQWVRR